MCSKNLIKGKSKKRVKEGGSTREVLRTVVLLGPRGVRVALQAPLLWDGRGRRRPPCCLGRAGSLGRAWSSRPRRTGASGPLIDWCEPPRLDQCTVVQKCLQHDGPPDSQLLDVIAVSLFQSRMFGPLASRGPILRSAPESRSSPIYGRSDHQPSLLKSHAFVGLVGEEYHPATSALE